MLAIPFIEAGLMLGICGLAKAILAFKRQKEAEKVNKRASELLKNVPAEDGVPEVDWGLEPMMPALKKGVLPGAGLGILAAFGACGMAGVLAVMGRCLAMAYGRTTEKCTILMVLGNGSLAVEALVLAGIVAGMLVAVLGTRIQKTAGINYERAYSNLFQVKRIRREIRWKLIMDESENK